MADRYLLKVTAGATYAASDQHELSPNTEVPFRLSTPHLDALLTVRVQNYRGLPSSAPHTSPYFSLPAHKHDLYSLQFTLLPKTDLAARDLVLGNDFDHPIRDKLPPGFDQAFRIVKWFIDPGLEGDVYADEPGLFGPLLSSINTFRVGDETDALDGDTRGEVRALEEGAASEGARAVREAAGVPREAAARKKHFLAPGRLDGFALRKGREYGFDFFNPYLDFNEFALKLPGFSVIPGITIPVISYWDGQPLRYVLKNRATNEPLFVVIFTLVPKDDADAVPTPGSSTNTAAKPAPPEQDPVQGGGDDDVD